MKNPTIVMLTDRNDLDDQLFGTFSMGFELVRQTPVQAESRDHLVDLQRQLRVAAEAGGVLHNRAREARSLPARRWPGAGCRGDRSSGACLRRGFRRPGLSGARFDVRAHESTHYLRGRCVLCGAQSFEHFFLARIDQDRETRGAFFHGQTGSLR